MNIKNKKKILWKGKFHKFPEKKINFFETDLWIKKLKKNMKFIKENNLFYDYLIYLIILSELKINKKTKILDFGGGLGELYFKLDNFIEKKFKFDLTIVENKKICKIANKSFKNRKNIKFYDNLNKINYKNFQIVHLGSCIQYINLWKDLIKSVSNFKPKYIVFSDVPLIKKKNFISKQVFNKTKIIPYRFINNKELIDCLKNNNYDLVSIVPFKNPTYYLQKVLPMRNFKKENRIKNTSNLLFKRK